MARYDMLEVLSLCGLSATRFRGKTADIDCPICGKRDVLHITLDYSGMFRCNKCVIGGGYLDFYAIMHNHFTLESQESHKKNVYYRPSEADRQWAREQIYRDLNESRSSPGYTKRMAQIREQAKEDSDAIYTNRKPYELNQIYSAFLEELMLTDTHKQKLLNRGLTEEEIEYYMFRTVPNYGHETIASSLLEKGLSLERVPGFYQLPNGTWNTFAPHRGYIIPVRDENRMIINLLIRTHFEKPKYLYLSSSKAPSPTGTKARSCAHIEGPLDARTVYITEGPLKAIVARNLLRKMGDDALFIALPGVTITAGLGEILDHVFSLNTCEEVYEFLDADKEEKKEVRAARTNIENIILRAIDRTHEKNPGFQVAYNSFPADEMLAKGIDDHLLIKYHAFLNS